MESFNLPNFGCLIDDIPSDIFNELVTESKLLEERNSTMVSGLTGNGVAKHYYMDDKILKVFLDYVLKLKDVYLNKFPDYLSTFRFCSDDVPFVCDKPWFNIQNKHEFIPNHIHDGVLSYSAWIKIPYDVNKEIENGKYASCFEFTYSSIIGSTLSKIIKIDKSYEGKIMMFPSALLHTVYPFYKCDDCRISLSGNILLDTLNAKLRS